MAYSLLMSERRPRPYWLRIQRSAQMYATTPPGDEASQRCLKEADVHIGSPQHGGACTAIGVVEAGGHILRADVGRVPDDEIGLRSIERAEQPLMLGLGKEVVARVNPCLHEVVGVCRGNSRVGEEFRTTSRAAATLSGNTSVAWIAALAAVILRP